jgi:hypothetical protein
VPAGNAFLSRQDQAKTIGARWRAKGCIMTSRRVFSAIGDIFTTFGSAVAASRAVESGRGPRADDRRKLGMDPAIFNRISRF